MELDLSVRLLVGGGLLNLVLSFVLGWVLSLYRTRGPMDPHRWLLTAHEVALQEGLLLLGLAFAMRYAICSQALALSGAALVVVASLFQDFSGIVNWLRHTKDQFAERSGGWILASINAVLNTAGLAILAYAIVLGLLRG